MIDQADLAAFYDRQKETHGSLATYAWIGSGLYLYVNDGGFTSLVSLSALGFFGLGMFAAALIFGALGYLAQRALGKALLLVIKAPSLMAATLISLLGWCLLILETAVVFAAARYVYGVVGP